MYGLSHLNCNFGKNPLCFHDIRNSLTSCPAALMSYLVIILFITKWIYFRVKLWMSSSHAWEFRRYFSGNENLPGERLILPTSSFVLEIKSLNYVIIIFTAYFWLSFNSHSYGDGWLNCLKTQALIVGNFCWCKSLWHKLPLLLLPLNFHLISQINKSHRNNIFRKVGDKRKYKYFANIGVVSNIWIFD